MPSLRRFDDNDWSKAALIKIKATKAVYNSVSMTMSIAIHDGDFSFYQF